jgi:branched-subunit amino acid aminotransferase/4-amino-4-deoxychorismate lyase
MIVYLNGRLCPLEEARIPVTDRGFLYGDALYENFRVYAGGFYRFEEHYRRLADGAAALRMPVPGRAEIRRIAGRLAAANGCRDGTLRVTLTRGPGGEGLRTRGAGPPTVLVTLEPVPAERWRRAEQGWTAIVATARRTPAALPGVIKSANRLDAILAKLEAEAAGVDEAILLSVDGAVAEGTTCNVFWRAGSTLFTPALEVGILPGVTRAAVLELVARAGRAAREGRYPVEALRAADEIFLTMTSLGPVPVRALDGRALPPAPDDWIPWLRRAYWDEVARAARDDPLPEPGPVETGTGPD